MRVLYINSFLSRFDIWTGERGRQLVDEMRAAGAEIETVPDIPNDRPADGTANASIGRWLRDVVGITLPRGIELLLVEYYLLLRGLFRTARWCWRVFRHRHQLKPDVIVARTFEYEWTPWIVAWMLRRPLVLEVHSPFYVERMMRGRRNSRILQRLERAQWRRAGKISVNSVELARILRENGVPSDNVHVINFGVRSRPLPDRPEPGPDGFVTVVFSGSFYTWHGIEPLLEAFAQARKKVGGMRLCLIGDGLTRAACEARARELGVADDVEFTGWLTHDAVARRLEAADVGMAPYLPIENFYFEPVKILDYMSAGLAIVASEQGRISELIQHGENGLLVPPGDVDAMTDALITLGQDSDLRDRLGREARARTPTLADTAAQILAICQNLVDNRADTKTCSPSDAHTR